MVSLLLLQSGVYTTGKGWGKDEHGGLQIPKEEERSDRLTEESVFPLSIQPFIPAMDTMSGCWEGEAIKHHSFSEHAAASHFLWTCLSHPGALQQQKQPSMGWNLLDGSRWPTSCLWHRHRKIIFACEQPNPACCSQTCYFMKLLICLTFSHLH